MGKGSGDRVTDKKRFDGNLCFGIAYCGFCLKRLNGDDDPRIFDCDCSQSLPEIIDAPG